MAKATKARLPQWVVDGLEKEREIQEARNKERQKELEENKQKALQDFLDDLDRFFPGWARVLGVDTRFSGHYNTWDAAAKYDSEYPIIEVLDTDVVLTASRSEHVSLILTCDATESTLNLSYAECGATGWRRLAMFVNDCITRLESMKGKQRWP